MTARTGALLALAVLAAAGVAAQEVPPPAAPSDTGFRWRRFDLHGRLLLRGLATSGDGPSTSDYEAENARLELRWRPARALHAALEYDQAEDRHLKDAYVALRPGRLELRAGQFKPPVSPVQLDSRWDLPLAERGLLSEALLYSFGIAGRRPGVELSWRPRGRGLSVAAGVFRASSVRGDRLGDEAFDKLAEDSSAIKATARLAWGRRRLQLGASFDLRPAEPVPGEGYRHFWTASGDVTLAAPKRGGPRAWLEGFVGSSWQDARPFDGRAATFLAGRAVGAWRAGGRKGRALYLEPFVAASVLDPDTSVRADVLWELASGLHAGGFSHLRLVLEAQHRRISRNAPPALGLLPFGEQAPRSRTRLVAQVGAAF